MRVSIVLTTDDGQTLHGEVDLAARRQSRSVPKRAAKAEKEAHLAPPVNLSSPVRPFVKKHSKGMSGAQNSRSCSRTLPRAILRRRLTARPYKSCGAK